MIDDRILVGSIDDLGARLRNDEFTVRELTEAYLDRLQRVGPGLNAVVTTTRDRAVAAADRLDEELTAGEDRGPLHGIPFGVKDLLAVDGYPTTWGAAPLRDQEVSGTATAVERLESAGGVLIAKLSMVELAGGLGYEQADASFTGPGLNPWNRDTWSGGSSSGAGSAVPAGLVGFAIGSETRGSIIYPSAYTGIAGLRPTYGRVSRHGAMALSWTMDKLGPMCRSARGCEHVLRAIAGPDPADPTTTDRAFDEESTVPASPTIAILNGATEDAQPSVRENYRRSLDVLDTFATIEPVDLPEYPYEAAADLIIAGEAAAGFGDFLDDGTIDELTAPANRDGGYAHRAVLAKDYINAMRVRTKIQRELDAMLTPYDALVTPSRFTVAPPIDRPFAEYREPYGGPPISSATNLAGVPGITVPNGVDDRDLPTGIAFTGRAFDEAIVLAFAKEYQQRTDHIEYADLLAT